MNSIKNTKDSYAVADELYSKIRILCIVMTEANNHYELAIHIKNTWGKRCNKLLFMSSVEGKYYLNINYII